MKIKSNPARQVLFLSLLVATIISATALISRNTNSQVKADKQYSFGTLQSSPKNSEALSNAGANLVVLSVSWKAFEPLEGSYDQNYINQLKSDIAAYKAFGKKIILSPGVQYAPTWVLNLPNSKYVNQFNDQYSSTESGKKIANSVFNSVVRDKQKKYYTQLFSQLGTDFQAVRLGGGWYGELNYPEHNWNGKTNQYWGFDDNALGKSTNLPSGILPNPIPTWTPGSTSTDHVSAQIFLDWYLNSLKNYQDWQIETVGALFPGELYMLYPSWGIRPGQITKAVASDLSGATSAEVNGEIPRGFDFERFALGITNQKVVLYTTWLDAPYGNDSSTNISDWTPAHFLSYLAAKNGLSVSGENTGHASYADMQRSFQKMADYGLQGIFWAFEPELFDGTHATIDQYKSLINIYSPTPSPTPQPSPTPISTPITTQDIIAPTVNIVSPLSGSLVNKNITLDVNTSAVDNIGITKVITYLDGNLKCTDSTAPYVCRFRIGGKAGVKHNITVKAFDAADNNNSQWISVTGK